MQRQDCIQSYLLDYSADQELPCPPVFVHGRFNKRISRQEIKGWSSPHLPQLFLNQNTPNRTKQNLKLKTIDFVAKKNNTPKTILNSYTNRQLYTTRDPQENHNLEKISLFKTFQETSNLNIQTLQPTQMQEQQQKLDFVKGRRINCNKVRNTLIVKPFFTTFSIRNNNCKSQNSHRLQQRQAFRTKSIRSYSNQKPIGVSVISYPIDESAPFERDDEGQQIRVASFLRKFRK